MDGYQGLCVILNSIVRIIQSNSHNFFLSTDELKNRKCFINDVRTCIHKLEEQLNDPVNKAKAEQVLRKVGFNLRFYFM